jgi:hypothetical protein
LISESHLRTLCEIWVGVIECLLCTIIKILQISDVYTWDPSKNPKMSPLWMRMETLNFEVLNGSHMYTSFFYNFLIIVLNKYSTTPMETLLPKVWMSLTNNSLSFTFQQKQLTNDFLRKMLICALKTQVNESNIEIVYWNVGITFNFNLLGTWMHKILDDISFLSF